MAMSAWGGIYCCISCTTVVYKAAYMTFKISMLIIIYSMTTLMNTCQYIHKVILNELLYNKNVITVQHGNKYLITSTAFKS